MRKCAFILFILVFFNQKSEFDGNFAIHLSSSKIVGNGPLLVGNIGYPIVTVHIGDAESLMALKLMPISARL